MRDFQTPFRSRKCCLGQCGLTDMGFGDRKTSGHLETLGRSRTLEYVCHLTGNAASGNLFRDCTSIVIFF